MRRHAIALALAVLAACDATERAAESGAAPAPARNSREHETCSRTADCAGELRCFDGVCRQGRLSLVGDLYAAVGDRALTAGRAAEAVDAYAAALARYEQEKIDPPAALLCSHGGALAGDSDVARQELAARLLHRCLIGAPAGSFLRQRALADLAALMDRGLDPEVLARRELADQYLTRKPDAPAAAATAPAAAAAAAAPAATAAAAPAPAAAAPAAAPVVEVKVALDSRSRSRSVRKLTEQLDKSPEVDAALTACWKAHFDKTHEDTLAVAVPLRYGSAWDDDETYLSSWIKLEESPPAKPELAEATTCARQAVGPIVEAEGKKLREETRWQAVATFTVGPVKP